MHLHYDGELTIEAPQEKVWAFINNPGQVGHCLPDLQELNVKDDRHFDAVVRIGVGPVRGRFKMEVELQPEEAPRRGGLRLRGSGMGSGLQLTARIELEPAGEGATRFRWGADADVSGPLATVGGRLLDNQARKITEQLFATIRANLEDQAGSASTGTGGAGGGAESGGSGNGGAT
ncbi:carbon monoxide dehydrogenase subunit G [Thermaerobacter composti]|uniref:Carbon monoxide dehydrogenase subunit G n=1 Tax=Thermaerobacter composti TaxID=554949 RepID=A0ABZ0QLX3_9FIRM|nr:carbon monoxide dehydrogenase subunit G [Thermaerobacter composti]WPD18244.1 carbon monoxide dehydrogenase subunit G [Thermaerobacter composti]